MLPLTSCGRAERRQPDDAEPMPDSAQVPPGIAARSGRQWPDRWSYRQIQVCVVDFSGAVGPGGQPTTGQEVRRSW